MAAGAGGTDAASADQGDEDAVALSVGGVWACGGDDACGLVAKDDGERAAPDAVCVREVGMADRAGFDIHGDLACAGGCDVDVFDA